MTIISNIIDEAITRLNNDPHFKNIKITKAYPFVVKPTRLSKIVVCLSLNEVDADSIAIGQNHIYCNYTVCADIFVPFNIGAQCIDNVMKDIINNYKNKFPTSIKTSGIEADRTTLCYTARCSLSFNELLEEGEISNGF